MTLIESYLNKQPTSKSPDCLNYGEGLDVHWDSYDLSEEKPDFIHTERQWVPLDELANKSSPKQLRLPFGDRGFIDFGGFVRYAGYIPILSFAAAYMEFCSGLDTIFQKAIQNDNYAMKLREFQDSAGHLFVNSVKYRVHVNLTQRIALLAMGVTMIFRAVINCCQIGVIFLPVDILFNYVFPFHRTPSKKSDFEVVDVKIPSENSLLENIKAKLFG